MRRFIVTFILVGLVGSLTFLAHSLWNPPSLFLSPPKERIDVSRLSVVTEVRSLGQLVSYTMEQEKIIESGTWGGNALKRAWYKDHLLFIANGTVVAGFDLQALTPQDVVETTDMITVKLGSPKLLFSRIDNQKSRVYERDVGMFNSPDLHLESRTRQQAEKTLRETACQQGILEKAGESGRKVVATLLTRVLKAANSHKQVVVTFSVGSC